MYQNVENECNNELAEFITNLRHKIVTRLQTKKDVALRTVTFCIENSVFPERAEDGVLKGFIFVGGIN